VARARAAQLQLQRPALLVRSYRRDDDKISGFLCQKTGTSVAKDASLTTLSLAYEFKNSKLPP
jgi:hypothetical protein